MTIYAYLMVAIAAISLFIGFLALYLLKRGPIRDSNLTVALMGYALFVYSITIFLRLSPSTEAQLSLNILKFQQFFRLASYLALICGIYYFLSRQHKRLLKSSILFLGLLMMIDLILPASLIFRLLIPPFEGSLVSVDGFLKTGSGITPWLFIMLIGLVYTVGVALYMVITETSKLEKKEGKFAMAGVVALLAAGIYDLIVVAYGFSQIFVQAFVLFGGLIMLLLTLQHRITGELNRRNKVVLNEKVWEQFVTEAQLIAITLNRMGIIDYVNPYLLEITGYKREEVIGKDWFHFFLPPNISYDMQVAFLEIVEHQFHKVYYNPILTKSGEERMIAWHNVTLKDPVGKINGIMSIGLDITDISREDEEIKASLKESSELARRLREDIDKMKDSGRAPSR